MNQYETVLEKLKDPEWWISNITSDLYFSCRNIYQTLEDPTNGYKDLYAPTHRALCDFVKTYAYEGQKLIILLPRGWIKSYIITVGWVIQRLLNNFRAGVREHFIISNATIGNSKEFLEKIKYNLKYNDFLAGLFREYIPIDPENDAERWTQDEIQLQGNKIETGSVEGNLVSRHYKILINDDLVNRDNSQTAEQILKVVDWWKLAQSLLLPDGIEIVIGTRWQFDDLYGYLIDNFLKVPKKMMEKARTESMIEWHEGNYHLFQMSCWENPEEETGSTFPTMFPEEKLKEIQKQQMDRFGGQYLNDPLAMSDRAFQYVWFKKYKDDTVPAIKHTVMTVDVVGKEKDESDFTGMAVVDFCPNKKGYIRYAQRKLITDMNLIHWIVETAIQYQPEVIGIEENKYNLFIELMELELPNMIRKGDVPPEYVDYIKLLPYLCKELKHRGRNKRYRIKQLAGWFEAGNYLFPMEGVDDLLQELIRFPAFRKDDLADALAYSLDLIEFPKEDDPVKYLIVPEDLKMTAEKREQKEWEEIREIATLQQIPYSEEADDLD